MVFRSSTICWISLAALCARPLDNACASDGGKRPIRMGSRGSIVAVHPGPAPAPSLAAFSSAAPHPEPRLAGFSPLVAITATNERSRDDIDYEHDLQLAYTCNPLALPSGAACGSLSPPAHTNYVVGILDSGAVVDLIAGSATFILGVDSYLTTNAIPIGGVGGTVNAFVTHPIGYYASGLGAVDGAGMLDTNALVGHSNTSLVAAPPIDCGNGEAVAAVIGTPFLAFYNSIISVDTPRRVVSDGQLFKSPDVIIEDPLFGLPQYDRLVAIEFGGFTPALTASYYPVLDPEDLITPLLPTQLSLSPLSIPLGGVFFATIQLREGPVGEGNPAQAIRVMVDTGAQSSIISPAVAANLSLPVQPDFTVDVCGVGGFETGKSAYYVDYVRMNALGGAMEFSNAPFVVLDLVSPEGDSLDGVLGMNFFWNRNIALQPSLTTSGFLHVSNPIAVAPCDLDVDQRVDLDDFLILDSCLAGPMNVAGPECRDADVDGSGTVDLADFRWVQSCYNGASAADPGCGP